MRPLEKVLSFNRVRRSFSELREPLTSIKQETTSFWVLASQVYSFVPQQPESHNGFCRWATRCRSWLMVKWICFSPRASIVPERLRLPLTTERQRLSNAQFSSSTVLHSKRLLTLQTLPRVPGDQFSAAE